MTGADDLQEILPNVLFRCELTYQSLRMTKLQNSAQLCRVWPLRRTIVHETQVGFGTPAILLRSKKQGRLTQSS